MATAATAWPQAVPSSSHAGEVAETSGSQPAAEAPPAPAPQRVPREQADRFYGHRELAELCERVIMALFACPLDSTASSVPSSAGAPAARPAPRLSEFIAYALHRTRLPLAVTHQALFLLKRLKTRFPAARGSSGHRLFISALMLASKSSCDDTYSNKSWTIVGQGLFSLREVNQMERELFGYLGFKVNVENDELEAFVGGLKQGRIVNTEPTPRPIPVDSPKLAPLPTDDLVEEDDFDGADLTEFRSSSPLSFASSNDSQTMPDRRQSDAGLPSHAAIPRGASRFASTSSSRASIAGYPMSDHHSAAAAAVANAASSSAPAICSTALSRTASEPQQEYGRSYASAPYLPSHVNHHGVRKQHAQASQPYLAVSSRDRIRSYTTPSHNVSLYAQANARSTQSQDTAHTHSANAVAAAAAAAAAQAAAHAQACANAQASFYSHVLPSEGSLVASSRGSFSASSDSSSYASSSNSMTPSPYISRSDASTPDTPPSELATSPWAPAEDDKASIYSDASLGSAAAASVATGMHPAQHGHHLQPHVDATYFPASYGVAKSSHMPYVAAPSHPEHAYTTRQGHYHGSHA